MDKSRVLFFDCETAGVNSFKSDLGVLIVFGWKWADEKDAHSMTIDQFPGWLTKKGFSDKKFLQAVSKIMNEAGLLVAHFGSVFDRRYLQGRLLINGLPPISRTPMRDTCFMARKIGAFSNNRLGHLAKILKLENRKLDNGWPHAWMRALAGDQKALKGLATYCRGDVLALEELYNRLAAFDHNHPRIIHNQDGCGLCGGRLNYRGFAIVNHLRYRRTQCTKCGHWSRETRSTKETN